MNDFIARAQDLIREVRLFASRCIRPSFHLEMYDCNGTALDSFTLRPEEVAPRITGYICEGYKVTIAVVAEEITIKVQDL